MMFRLYCRKFVTYFMRWKVLTKIPVAVQMAYAQRSLKCRHILRLMQDKARHRAKRAIDIWRFQVKQGMLYNKMKRETQRSSIEVMESFLMRVNRRIKRTTGKCSSFHYHELFLLIDRLCWMVQLKLNGNMKMVMRQFKVLFEVERLVIQSNKPLFIRTISVNAQEFRRRFPSSSSNAFLSPATLVKIFEGSRKIKERKAINSIDAPHSRSHVNYYENFLEKMRFDKSRVSDSEILTTGIWAANNPFLRLREFLMIKLFSRAYVKWMRLAFHKFRFNKYFTDLTRQRRVEIRTTNKDFQKTWSRMLIMRVITDKIEQLSLKTIIAFEAQKKKHSIDTQYFDSSLLAKSEIIADQIFKIQQIGEFEDHLRDVFKKKLQEVKKTFAKHYLVTILRPGVNVKVVHEDVMNLIIDTIYYVTCGTINDINLRHRGED